MFYVNLTWLTFLPIIIFSRFYLEEPHGTQKLYMGSAVPPTKVAYVGDKEQSMWVKEVQGISEQ